MRKMRGYTQPQLLSKTPQHTVIVTILNDICLSMYLCQNVTAHCAYYSRSCPHFCTFLIFQKHRCWYSQQQKQIHCTKHNATEIVRLRLLKLKGKFSDASGAKAKYSQQNERRFNFIAGFELFINQPLSRGGSVYGHLIYFLSTRKTKVQVPVPVLIIEILDTDLLFNLYLLCKAYSLKADVRV